MHHAYPVTCCAIRSALNLAYAYVAELHIVPIDGSYWPKPGGGLRHSLAHFPHAPATGWLHPE